MCFPKIDSCDNILRSWSVSASPFHLVLSLFLFFHFSKVKIPVIHSHITMRITQIRKVIVNFQDLKHKNTVKCVPWSPKFVWIKTFQAHGMTSCFSLDYIIFFSQKIGTLDMHFSQYSGVLISYIVNLWWYFISIIFFVIVLSIPWKHCHKIHPPGESFKAERLKRQHHWQWCFIL